MNDLIVIQNALAEVVKSYEINFAKPVTLEDEEGNQTTLYEFQHSGGWFGLMDTDGKVWMNAAAIVHATGLSKASVQNTLDHIFTTPLAELCEVYLGYTRNQSGVRRKMTIYNDFIITMLMGRSQKHNPTMMRFLRERENLVNLMRRFVWNFNADLQLKNADLAHELHAVNADLNDRLAQDIADRWGDDHD